MTRAILIALGVVVIVYGVLSWEFADRLIGGQFLPPDEEVDFAEYGLPKPEIATIANADIELSAWYFAHPETAGCAVVVAHGFTGNKAQMLAPGAKLFFERGCDILVYDLRGHGASSRGLLTYGYFDKEDQMAVIDWLMKRTGLPDDRIGLWGVSYGAATSLQTAAARPGLAFVIADASFSSLPDIAAVQADRQIGVWARVFMPGALAVAGWRAGFDPSEASPETAIRGLEAPVLLVHSTTDAFTPVEQSEAIFAAADPARTRLIRTRYGAPHGESFWTAPIEYTGYVDAFLDDFVPDFGSR
jgi:dipeptidyl aminopeptidase/acylaminoacyl peptidase